MRSGVLVSLIVVALCAGAVAFERRSPLSAGDILVVSSGEPNDSASPAAQDPNGTWDPAEHLVADWESVAVNMGSLLLNPRVRPDVEPPGPQWSLSVTAIIDIIDSNGLIGWSHDATLVTAYDQDGRVVSSTTSSPSVRMYHQPQYMNRPTGPNGEWESVLLFNQVSLKLPMEPDAVYPEVLSRVEWTMNVLVADETETIDIPFEASETWVELIPGTEILVEQATVEEGKYQYRVKYRYDRAQVQYLFGGPIYLWNEQEPPAAAVLKLDVLDAKGRSLRALGGGSSSSGSSGGGSGNQMTGAASGSGACDACGTAATLQFTVVFNPYEQEARFVLEDIPVPRF